MKVQRKEHSMRGQDWVAINCLGSCHEWNNIWAPEWGFLKHHCCYCCLSLQLCPTLQPHGLPGPFVPECWSRLPCPPPVESFQSRDQTPVSCIAGRFVVTELPRKPRNITNVPQNYIPPFSLLTMPSITYPHLYIHICNLFFKNFLIFNWRIIALQYCVGFCHTSI